MLFRSPFLCFIKLLAKIAHDTAVLITDKQTTIRIDLTLQGGPNTHDIRAPQGSRMATFHKFFYAMCHVVPQPMASDAYLLTPSGEPAAFRPDPQFHALSEGVMSSTGVRRFKSVKYCMLRRFTVAHKHGM